ncbi:MAG: MFS transporter [Cyanobacteria bacterium P01_D01_bin.73]
MTSHSPDSRLIKLTLLLTSTLTVMAGTTIAPSLPAMEVHFTDVEENAEFWVQLLLTMPAIFIACGAPLAGQLVDTVGRKPLLIGSAALYGLAGSSGFVLDSLFQMSIGRGFLGIAVAGIMVSVTTLIADYYQGDRRSQFMGLQAAFMSLGGVAFLSVGGLIADVNWRFPFLIYLFSWLLIPAIIGVLYEPSSDQFEKFSISKTASETQPIKAEIPFKLLGLIYGAALIMQMVFYMIPVHLPFYLRQLSQASASQSGLAIALATLFGAIPSIGYGKIKQKFSFIEILSIAFLLMGIGYVGISFANSYALILLALIPTGLGLGLLMPNLNFWTTTAASASLRGRALGGLTTCFFLGRFLSPIATQLLRNIASLSASYGLYGVFLIVVSAIAWIYQRQITRLVDASSPATGS